MARKDTNLKNKTVAELEKESLEVRDQIVKGMLDLKMRKAKNTNLVKNLKIKLAKILTHKREQELIESL